MNPQLAISPLVQHIPHAVPVVIIWVLMARFWLAQRKLKQTEEAAPRPPVYDAAGSGLAERMRAGSDGTPPGQSVGREPVGIGLEEV